MLNQPLNEAFQEVNAKVGQSITGNNTFDFIVVGLGSMGAPTCYYLATRGYSVLGLEQFDITHENGSHGGQSRLIRKAYWEHPDYVPLLDRAYENWQAIQDVTETKLYHPTGILYAGQANDFIISGTKKSAKDYDIELNELSRKAQINQYPQFTLPEDYSVYYEPGAGFLTPERAIITYTKEAIKHGAEIHTNESLVSFVSKNSEIKVKTNKNNYTAKKIILTSGAWTPSLLPSFKPHLKVTRQMIAWVNTSDDTQYKSDKMPCWVIKQEDLPGTFYGFPALNPNEFGGLSGIKIGYHFPGVETDTENINRLPNDNDQELIVNFLQQYMPGCFKSINEFKSCMYTYTLDENFIVDFHPNHENVILATGFSGHGFKFSSVIGEILADLAIKGKTDMPIEFLSADRL